MINALFKRQRLLPGTSRERSQRNPPSCGGLSSQPGRGRALRWWAVCVDLCWEKAPLSSESRLIFDSGFLNTPCFKPSIFAQGQAFLLAKLHITHCIYISAKLSRFESQKRCSPCWSSSGLSCSKLVLVRGWFRV